MERNMLKRLMLIRAEQVRAFRFDTRKLRLVLFAAVFASSFLSLLAVRAHNLKEPGSDRALLSSRVSGLDASPVGPETTESVSPPPRSYAQTSILPKQTDSVLITITPRGFDVAQITSPAVPFFLLVENRSGLSSVSLQLDAVAGAHLMQPNCAAWLGRVAEAEGRLHLDHPISGSR